MTFAFGSSQIKQIAVAAGDTLNGVRDAINADADLTAAGVTASVVADGSNFKLVIQHDATLTATGPAGLGLATPELTIERTSNTVDDLFTGMTINLFQAEVGTDIELDIEQNLTGVRDAITTFVDSYNAVKSFINQQGLVDETTGGPATDAGPLFGNPALASIEQNLSGILGGGAEGLSSGFQVLREIGIDFVDNGLDHPVDEGVGGPGHCSTSSSSFSSPSVISRSMARTSRINSAGSSSGTGSATRGL